MKILNYIKKFVLKKNNFILDEITSGFHDNPEKTPRIRYKT